MSLLICVEHVFVCVSVYSLFSLLLDLSFYPHAAGTKHMGGGGKSRSHGALCIGSDRRDLSAVVFEPRGQKSVMGWKIILNAQCARGVPNGRDRGSD
jgi:hypothetical protein